MTLLGKLLSMSAALTCVVGATVLVIQSYDGPVSRLNEIHTDPSVSPQMIRELLQQAAVYLNDERIPEAEQTLRRILLLDRNNLSAMRMLGNLYFFTGRYSDAANLYRRIVNRNPGDAAAHNNLGQSMVRMSWYEAGIRELEAAKALDPELPYIDLNIAIAYRSLGNEERFRYYMELAERKAPPSEPTVASPPEPAVAPPPAVRTEAGESYE